MRIDPVLELLRYPYGYHLVLRIELIAIYQRRFIHFLLNKYFSIKMILKNGVRSKVDGQEGLNWTLQTTESERPRNKKVDDPKR